MPEPNTNKKGQPQEGDSPVQEMFRAYAAELDRKHDRHERLVKISRDVTIESKRIIFFLHSLTKSEDRTEGLKSAEKRLATLGSGVLRKAATELQSGAPAVAPLTHGLQEMAEALCLLHHLQDPTAHCLPPVTALTDLIAPNDPACSLRMLPIDFMLGVADFTGELMRLCINSAAGQDAEPCLNIREVMQHLYTGFVGINQNCHRDMHHKMTTLRQSLLKVESACCDLRLRAANF